MADALGKEAHYGSELGPERRLLGEVVLLAKKVYMIPCKDSGLVRDREMVQHERVIRLVRVWQR